LENITTEEIRDIPRTIYFFGSSTSSAVVAFYVYLMRHPESLNQIQDATKCIQPNQLLAIGIFFACSFFAMGVISKKAIDKRVNHQHSDAIPA
jgi:hypothetical protein